GAPIAGLPKIGTSSTQVGYSRLAKRRLEGWPLARCGLWPSFETRARARSSESDSILMAIVSGPCQTPRKHANAGKEDPRLGARDCFLEILGEPSASVEPSKRPFNHPTSRLGLERTD